MMSEKSIEESVKELQGSEKSLSSKEELRVEGDLLSLEKLDRSSPDLWPEKIPGITDFIAMSDTPIRTSAPEWALGLTQEEVEEMTKLSELDTHSMVLTIKTLYDEAYKLGVIEAKQMTRGKYLDIFNKMK